MKILKLISIMILFSLVAFSVKAATTCYDVDMSVVGLNCDNSWKIVDYETVSAPLEGIYRVTGEVHRGFPGQCQANEDFYLRIHGENGPETEDDANPCAVSVRWDYLGDFHLNQGSNTIAMITAAQCPPDTTANSVELERICIEYVPECGDGIVSSGEDCELPETSDNANCGQSTTTCSGTKTGTRDAFGNCNSGCDCYYDPFTYSCIAGRCGAECAVDADCDDQDEYTLDTCNADCGCEYEQLPYCGDGNLDDGEECDDGNNVNGDGCSAICEEEGCIEDDDCDDNNVCNGLETCVAGLCQAGTPLDCDDGDICTDDMCDPLTGCEYPFNTAPCDDGNLCTENDICNQGACSGAEKDCSGNNIGMIANCDNNPDWIHSTFDFRFPFISTCEQTTGECDSANSTILHVCSALFCQAQCGIDLACPSGQTCNMASCTCEGQVPVCGDGAVNQVSEECDDGNLINGDGCNAQCQDEYCGDAIINDVDEECEINADCAVDETCVACECVTNPPVCGNQILEAGEECEDDGDCDANEHCADCACVPDQAVCGNDITEPGEECD